MGSEGRREVLGGHLPLRRPGRAVVLLVPSFIAFALPFVGPAFSVSLVALVAVLVAVLVAAWLSVFLCFFLGDCVRASLTAERSAMSSSVMVLKVLP